MVGTPVRRAQEELAELGLELGDVPAARPLSLEERTGLAADRRKLSESLAHKRGRPAKYSAEVVEAICARLIEGQTLTEICLALDDAPHLMTVYRWAEEDSGFGRALREARRIQATTIAELAYTRSRDAKGEEIAGAAGYLKAVQWLASKLDPHGYGERATPAGNSLNIADMAEADLEGLLVTLQTEKATRSKARQLPAAPASPGNVDPAK